jgi:hypothetical protein
MNSELTAAKAAVRGGFVSESRTGQRFPLHLPIKVRTAAKEHRGMTGDMSAAGVYIVSDSEFEVGANLEFDIVIPGESIGAEQDVEIHCKGHVVRSGSDPAHGGKNGVACVIDQYTIVRNS